jgi:hypothetical protein
VRRRGKWRGERREEKEEKIEEYPFCHKVMATSQFESVLAIVVSRINPNPKLDSAIDKYLKTISFEKNEF